MILLSYPASSSLPSHSNFIKATYAAITQTYAYLTPDLWPKLEYPQTPFEEFSSHLTLSAKKFAA